MPDRVVPKAAPVTEALTLHGCLEYLAQLRVFAWRNNTGAIVIDRRPIRYGHPGSSDVLAVLDDRFRDPGTGRSLAGVLLCVEVKSPKGRQEADQKLFERSVTKRGALYLLVRSVEEMKVKLAPYWIG